jgi:(2R)-3-sulfolactate dehydrogenase (NADP+)
MGFGASSFSVDEGNKSRIDQAFLVISRGAGGHRGLQARIETLLSVMLQDENMRLPSYRRHDLAHRSKQQGLEISEVTVQKLGKLASKS